MSVEVQSSRSRYGFKGRSDDGKVKVSWQSGWGGQNSKVFWAWHWWTWNLFNLPLTFLTDFDLGLTTKTHTKAKITQPGDLKKCYVMCPVLCYDNEAAGIRGILNMTPITGAWPGWGDSSLLTRQCLLCQIREPSKYSLIYLNIIRWVESKALTWQKITKNKIKYQLHYIYK